MGVWGVIAMAPLGVLCVIVAALYLRRKPFDNRLLTIVTGVLIGLSFLLSLIAGGRSPTFGAILFGLLVWFAVTYVIHLTFKRFAQSLNSDRP